MPEHRVNGRKNDIPKSRVATRLTTDRIIPRPPYGTARDLPMIRLSQSQTLPHPRCNIAYLIEQADFNISRHS
jgi:hypothetical protein